MKKTSNKDRVWDRAATVRGKDPAKYRRDTNGNEIFYDSYGKNTKMGWEVDHKKPKAKGGSDNIRNLQALQTRANRIKSDKY